MILNIVQIAVSILLITAILMQRRGSGLSGAFGGSGGGAYYQKRGFEKLLFNGTIVLAGLFVGLAVINLLR